MTLYQKFVKGVTEPLDYTELKKNYRIEVPENFNFAYDIVDRYAHDVPEKKALVWCDDNGEEKIFNFKEISDYSQQAANFLVGRGIKKGDMVMLILRRRYEFWWLIVALHRIGAIVVPATDELLAKDLEYRNNAAGIKMIISVDVPEVQAEIEKSLTTSPSVKSLVSVGKAREGWIDFHAEMKKYGKEFPRPTGDAAVHNKDIMLVYFTSGTTAYPKMVQHDFTYPLGHITTAKFWQNVIDDGLHLTVSSTGWAKAMWGKLYGQWICGTALFVYDMGLFTPDKLLNKMAHYGVTTFCAPPTVYRYLVRQDLSKYDFSQLKYCATAGEALNAEVFKRFEEQTGHKIHEGYGQTESTILAGSFPGMDLKPGSMGKPSPGYDVEIIDAYGKPCKPGDVGEICIHVKEKHPIGLFVGYYHDVSHTAEAFDSGVYHTGDTAYADEDGYFWFVGRTDDIIKSAGFRISPFEVESVLQEHPAVLECAVTGVEDPKRGQLVKATIVLSPGYTASDALSKEIQEYVIQNTANYKHPRLIEFVDELPKTISGKIRRVAIREKDNGPEIKSSTRND